MAAKKKKSTAAKTKHTKTASSSNRQLHAVIWFTVAIFLMCVVFIKGENIWTHIHNFMFGVFGVMAYFYPFLLGFVAVLVAMDKASGTMGAKVIETAILAVLIGSCVDAFAIFEKGVKFSQHINEAYNVGVKGGGFMGALISHPICNAFGRTPAIITIFLLIFVFLMIITGTTLITLFRTLSRPVKSISAQAENAYKARAEREETEEKAEQKEKKLKVIKGFNVDIPVDDIPEKRRPAESLEEKQRKVLDAYYDSDDEKPEEPQGVKEKRKLKNALKTASEEAKTENADESADQSKKEPAEPMPTPEEIAQETREMSETISGNMEITEDEGYTFPPITLLNEPKGENAAIAAAELDSTAEHLVETLRSFGVETRIVDISRGPTVTRYELQPCAGVKISKITNLADDIALNLATAGVRIEAPIPNKAAVGIEVPNKASAVVGVREIIESPAFTSSKSKLTVAMGRDIAGNVVVTDIAKMPHGLIAGATGSGKSVCINSIVVSILYKASPDEVKLLMIDPKVVELGVYNGIPHLLVPVVTEPRKAAGALGWAVSEMEKRYQMFADRGARNIEGYNNIVEGLVDEPDVKKMPHIVIIIDELADLMMTAPHEVEDSINRIAAKARAAGMHLLIATQRPSVDVVTGVIKSNVPSRIAFAVSSQVDSRTILDAAGAEKLLGRGDMLFSPVGSTKPKRLQGCFVSDEEVESVVEFIKNGGSADYDDFVMNEIETRAIQENNKKISSAASDDEEGDDDPMLDEAIKVVVENGLASTSLLQRKLKLGYARAARIVDAMEERGIVGPYEGSKPRKVLITKEQLMEREAGEE